MFLKNLEDANGPSHCHFHRDHPDGGPTRKFRFVELIYFRFSQAFGFTAILFENDEACLVQRGKQVQRPTCCMCLLCMFVRVEAAHLVSFMLTRVSIILTERWCAHRLMHNHA